MITLYDCATAPSPRRARILLAEKGVTHHTVQVDLKTGEQMGEAYRAINPQCTVPALRTEEGTVLSRQRSHHRLHRGALPAARAAGHHAT
jgi:glutathione S-transferase